MGVDRRVRADAQKVHMLHLLVDGMALQVPHHGLLRLAIDNDVQDLRVERLLLHGLAEFIGVQDDRLRRSAATVDDARQLTVAAAQAAAGAGAHLLAGAGVQFDWVAAWLGSNKVKVTNVRWLGCWCGRHLTEHGAQGLLMADPADGFGQQAVQAELMNLRAGCSLAVQGNGVRHHHLVNGGGIDAINRRTGQHRMG